ncbi:MAG TPA: Fur family transcriptional regulator [Spirochaetia bacterium]|nr:Fur family transcriptional regulator [Spirochaetia bacterium]
MKEDLVMDRLRKNGYKITPQRQEILKAFIDNNSGVPLSAEEIHQAILEKHPNISLDTVYRNLNVLNDLEVLCKLNLQDGKSRYQLSPGNHHHHLVCLRCGKSDVIDFCPFKSLDQQKIADEKNFEIKRHSFEIFGYCDGCRDSSVEHRQLIQDAKSVL